IGASLFYLNEYIYLIKDYIRYALLCIMLIPLPIAFMKIKTHFRVRNIYKSINIKSLKTRLDIYSAIKSLEGNHFYINKLIDNIELNISSVKGDWPDKNILCSTSGIYTTKLCQLDVRWLGID
ncbi:hypothetical protein OH460_26570, partial [Vibrio sp. Makdt]|uniref:hypothetical protein n=1 Tax=Vibrio sp. Makdt TaxID=2998828 RepID=UPI0022CD546A